MSMRTTLAISLLLVSAAHAYGARLPVVVVPTGGCPDQAALEAELDRLLPVPPPSAYASAMVVADLGDRFAVAVFGAQRIFVDAERDCAERARTAAVALAVTLAPPTVSFGDPGAADEAVAAPPPSAVPEPSLTRAAPRRSWLRHGLVVAAGASCLDVKSTAEECYGVVRLGYELTLAELHLGFIGAGPGLDTFPTPNGPITERNRLMRSGVQLGVDLGTPYLRLARWGSDGALRVAFRASADFDFWIGGMYHSADFSNTYGPSLAVDVSRHVSLSARAAVGWSALVRQEDFEATVDVDVFASLLAQF